LIARSSVTSDALASSITSFITPAHRALVVTPFVTRSVIQPVEPPFPDARDRSNENAVFLPRAAWNTGCSLRAGGVRPVPATAKHKEQ